MHGKVKWLVCKWVEVVTKGSVITITTGQCCLVWTNAAFQHCMQIIGVIDKSKQSDIPCLLQYKRKNITQD